MSESYYKVVDGKKYKRSLLEYCASAADSNGNINLEEAKEIFRLIADGDTYTDIEKDTMAYVRKQYKFTEAANNWLRTEIRKWAAGKRGGEG